jgi:peptidoglycan-associated lipoprotein
MLKRLSIWLVILIFGWAIALGTSGCAKKQIIKEEAAAKPAAEVQKETPKVEAPKVAEKPREEVSQPKQAIPLERPKEEAKPQEALLPKEKPEILDLSTLRIQFAFDDYNLSNQAKEILEKIAKWMAKNPEKKIQIQGHTCDIGTAEYNLALGEQRANSAKRYLKGLGISEERLAVISYGLEKPRFPNNNEANRSLNRRDEFVSVK